MMNQLDRVIANVRSRVLAQYLIDMTVDPRFDALAYAERVRAVAEMTLNHLWLDIWEREGTAPDHWIPEFDVGEPVVYALMDNVGRVLSQSKCIEALENDAHDFALSFEGYPQVFPFYIVPSDTRYEFSTAVRTMFRNRGKTDL